jgi:predicted TIM-barrel fold metal-dependent hydrolase
MIIDFHTHIFPRVVQANREKYFANEPAFQLLYNSPRARLVNAEEMVQAMDEEGVDVSVVFGFPWKNLVSAALHNDYIMEAVARYPDRLKGFCCLDPCDEMAASEVERCLKGGLCGVGELAFYQSGIVCAIRDSMAPVMAICQEKSLPVLIHTNEPVGHAYPGKTENTLSEIYEFIKQFPMNKIVLAHWGGGIFFYGLLKKEVRETLKNVWIDTAASPFLYDPAIYRHAIDIIGREKILFGSDYPLIKPARYFSELRNTGLTQDEFADICGGNAGELLGL